jgi:hypothetical protein
VPRHLLNPKKIGGRKAAGPDVPFPQLASDGASLQLFDAQGNVVTTPLDTTKTSVAWTSSDATVITVTPSADGLTATLKSTGKAGTGVTVTATFTNLDGSTPLPPAVSQGIDVPPGPPATATVALGVPA